MKKIMIYTCVSLIFISAAHAKDIDVVRSFYSEMLNKTTDVHLKENINSVLAPEWQSIGDYKMGPAKNRQQFLAQLQGMGKSTPDLHWSAEEIIKAGADQYIVRGRATGTPTADFMGNHPTGRSFDIMSIDIHTVHGGKIVKSYHVEDWRGAIMQITKP